MNGWPAAKKVETMNWNTHSKRTWWMGVAVLIAGGSLLAAVHSATGAGSATSAAVGKKSVIVELFTSEGCSSCPPADALLGQLRQSANANGAEVIALGFHVNYWDSAAWRDRFDSAAYTRRQQDYANKFHIDSPYTPQMVVNGEFEFVGSMAGKARETIAEASAQTPAAQVKIASAGTDKLQLEVTDSQPGDVMLAITEDNLVTKVGGGENGGRVLHHSAVVRELRRIGQVHEGSFSATVPLTVKEGWKRDDLRAVVFVQQKGNGQILGAASLPFSSLSTTN